MDSTDIRILEILSADAGITDTALSKEISLSVPAANKRVAKLCENGIIRKKTILTDARLVGKPVIAYTMVAMEHFSDSEKLFSVIEKDPDFLECYAITGDYDYMLKICAADIDLLERKILALKSVGIAKSNTMFTLKEHKFTPSPLPDFKGEKK